MILKRLPRFRTCIHLKSGAKVIFVASKIEWTSQNGQITSVEWVSVGNGYPVLGQVNPADISAITYAAYNVWRLR